MLPIPGHFRPESVLEVFHVAYEDRAREAARWRLEHGLRPAAEDSVRICLVCVDVQNTFCLPEFELPVPGAPDDNRRLCEFLYRNLDAVTRVVPTMDTHQATQIFHALWLVDEDGNHPPPYTLVSAGDVEAGRWRVSSAACESLGIDPESAQRHLLHYTRTLERGGKYELTVWPYHALLGGIGHALVSAVEEAIFFHGVARSSQPDFQVKGSNPLTEHYSVLGPEVTRGADGQPIAERNSVLVDRLLQFDAVVFAGQAKSHCVAWTIEDLLGAEGVRERRLAQRFYLLEDCTSPVVVPGVVDYTDAAVQAVARWTEAGMRVVRSTDPLESWPGIQDLRAAFTR
jgi:nicotinamidase-related amidase